jgi:hypothetical protein
LLRYAAARDIAPAAVKANKVKRNINVRCAADMRRISCPVLAKHDQNRAKQSVMSLYRISCGMFATMRASGFSVFQA